MNRKEDLSASEEERRVNLARAYALEDKARRDESLSRSSLPREWTQSQQNSVEEYDDWTPAPPTTSRSFVGAGRASVFDEKRSSMQRELEVR